MTAFRRHRQNHLMRRHLTVGFTAALFVIVAGPLLVPALSGTWRRSVGLPLGGGTTVSGVIDVDTTWSVGGSPFFVTGNLLVAGGGAVDDRAWSGSAV